MSKYFPWWAVFVVLAGCGGYEDGARAARLSMLARLQPPDRISWAWIEYHSCFEQMARATFTWRSYRNLLAELGNDRYAVVPLREFQAAKARHPDKVVVGLRHDMDGNFCKAPAMAAVEASMGVRSSYYVRHTDEYYAYDWPWPERRRAILPALREIQDRGHEVGLHFDVVSMAVEYGIEPAALLRTELEWLRGGGLDIVGVSHHGSPSAARHDFNNYEFFAGMTTRDALAAGRRVVPLGRHSLQEFALQYEAYHLGYEHYYSDVGGTWSPESPLTALPALAPGQSAVILTHPVWWGSDDDPFKYE